MFKIRLNLKDFHKPLNYLLSFFQDYLSSSLVICSGFYPLKFDMYAITDHSNVTLKKTS